jgi:hypothetical protein
MTPAVPVVVLVVLLCCVGWVYTDARARAESGNPVIFAAGNLRLDSPSIWSIACLVVWVVAFPLYLVSRHGPVGPRRPGTP